MGITLLIDCGVGMSLSYPFDGSLFISVVFNSDEIVSAMTLLSNVS
jgi:hypothetical protein